MGRGKRPPAAAILVLIRPHRDITLPILGYLRQSLRRPTPSPTADLPAGTAAPAAQPSTGTARIGRVNLGRIAWVLTVLACLVAVLILVLEGYYGYAGVTFAVALSAAINIV